MSVVSSSDAIAYAAAGQVVAFPTLNAETLNEIATATVSGYDDPYPAPHTAVNIGGWDTGASEDATENLLFRIERPSGDIVCWGVTRKDSTNSLFYPDAKSQGDFGYATNEGLLIQDDDVIRVYSNQHIWAMISRVAEGGTQYKRWDESYTNEGTVPPPVVNMGAHQQQTVDATTGLATFSFDGSASYDWLTGIQGGISTYTWTIPSTATITAGGTTLDNITFTIAAGEYEVYLAVTTLKGGGATGRRMCFANDRTDSPAFSDTYAISAIGSDTTDIDGWEGQFTVNGDLTGALFPGQRFLFTAPVTYDGVELNENDSFIDNFVGYLEAYSITTSATGEKSTTLDLKSPIKICKLLPSATQFMEEVKSPSAWTQVLRGLSDPAFAAFYILKYHTTVLDNHDMLHEDRIRDLRRRVFGFPSDTINAHLATIGVIMSGDVGCRSDGTINLVLKPNLQNDSFRDTRDEKFTWTDKNIRTPLAIKPKLRAAIAYLIMYAVSYSGDTKNPMPKYGGKAPGRAQAQGVSKNNIPDISVTTQGGAAELYRIIGHWFAYLNNPLDKLQVPLHAMWDICEPADPDWHLLDVSDSYLPVDLPTFGARWKSDMRWRPARVQRQWTNANGAWTKVITTTARVESKGLKGVFHPTFKGQVAPYIGVGGWLTDLEITMPQLNLDLDFALPTDDGYGDGFAFNDVGLSESSANFVSEKPDWALSSGFTGDVIDQCFDEQNEGAGFLLAYDSSLGKVRVQYNADVTGTPAGWSTVFSVNVGSDFHGRGRIVNNDDVTLMALIKDTQVLAWYDDGGWVSIGTIGDVATVDVDGASSDFGICVSGTTQIVIGRESTNNGYKLYRATTVGGAFSAVANHPGAQGSSPTPPPAVVIDGSGNIVVSYDVRAGVGSSGTFTKNDLGLFPSGNNGVSQNPAIISSANQDVDGTVSYNSIARYWTAENENGIGYTVSRIKWEGAARSVWPDTDATPPGAPDYYPPEANLEFYSGTLETRARLFDVDGSAVADSGWNEFSILDKGDDWTLAPHAAGSGYPDRTSFQTGFYYDGTFSPAAEGIRYWEIENRSPTGRNYFGDFRGSSEPQTGTNETHFVLSANQFYNVAGGTDVFYYDDKSNDGNHLYTIDGTDTWTDITPLDDDDLVRSVYLHNAIAVFGTDATAIVTDTDGAKTIIQGKSNTSAWVDIAATDHDWLRVLKSDGRDYLLGGDVRLDVTVDDFATIQSRIGVWIGSQDIFTDCVTPGFYYGY